MNRFEERETERLLIRRMLNDDWEAIHRYMSDPNVTHFLPEGTLDERGTQEFVRDNAGAEARALAVVHKGGGMLLGHMLYHPWFGPRMQEIGWVFAPEAQRQGYATEAAKSLMAHAFEVLGAHRLIATMQPENTASVRVAENLGMKREAYFRKSCLRPGNLWWDELFYALLAEEYAAEGGGVG